VLLRLVADPQQEDLREILRLAPYGGVIDQEVHSEERELIDRQGELIPVLWSGALLRNQQFGIRGALFSLRDLRPQQLQEQHRRSMERERHHAQKMASIGTLAGGVAHEFNNMLQPIMGFSALLLEQEQAHHRLPEKDFERLELIHQSAKRGSELVRQILDFSRKDQELPDQEQSMDALLAMALKMVRGTLPPGVQLYERISQQLGRVQINSTAFHQLLLNLCGNAVQAIAATDLEKGEITITAVRDTEQHCTITVKDNGEGMEEEVRKQVFDPFFTTREVGQGSGMGLPVVMGIIQRAGGKIELDSAVGKGSLVTIHLPMEPLKAGAEVVSIAPLHGSREQRILLVDDAPAVVAVGLEMLEEAGYQVETALSGSEALQRFSANPHDLVVTDLSMPGMSGMELGAQIQALGHQTPMVLLTGVEVDADSRQLKQSGIETVLRKPIAQSQLGEVIAKLL